MERKQLRQVLGATILGSALVFLDGSVVNVLLPALRRDFALSLSQAQWVIQSYLLFLSSLLMLGGSLGDHLGRKRIFEIGIVMFTLSSVACALSPSFSFLLIARAIQGVGGALLMPGSLAIIISVFPEHERGRAIGAWSSFTTLAVAAGPIVGGFLVDHFSWRWAFALNLPFAVAAWHWTRIAVPESCSEQHAAPLDFVGAAIAVLSLGGLTYGLMQELISVVVGGVVFFALFIVHEQRSKSPLLPLQLFRIRLFTVTNLLTFFLYGALGIIFFIVPFEMIEVGGFTAWQAGAAGFPFIGAVFLLSRYSGALLDRFGPRLPLTLGPSIAALGMVLLWVMATPHTPYVTGYLFPMLVLGVGMATTITPLTTSVMNSVGDTYAGTASGVNNTIARLSGLLAIAALPFVIPRVFGIPFRVDLACYRAALELAAILAVSGAVCGLRQ